jgi:fructose-bisphosphate aldolase class I
MAHHFSYLDKSLQETLKKVANSIVVEGKGILAMDEFNDGMEANLASVGQANTAENRRKYRQAILTSPGIQNYVGGVILYDETIWQKTDAGHTFPQHLASLGINPGAKVDTNITDLEGTYGECSAQGLDDLLTRARKYKEAGCTFAKWRCSIKIGQYLPSQLSIDDTAYLQARYARICQQVRKTLSTYSLIFSTRAI